MMLRGLKNQMFAFTQLNIQQEDLQKELLWHCDKLIQKMDSYSSKEPPKEKTAAELASKDHKKLQRKFLQAINVYF